jgi:hypothetical protein
MKTVIMAVALVVAVTAAGAQETSVQVASDKFEAFHEVMHPAWHDAYPSKDYAALIASGPKFEATYLPIAKLEPAIKNSARLAKFKSFRKEMGVLVTAFADACRKNDSTKAYEILPNLHTAFEEAMWELQPMEFKPLEGLLITADVILDFHIPGDNWDGMAGSTETILMKLDHITDQSYPPELTPVKTDMNAEFDKVRSAAGEMKTCADKKDMACFRTKATELKKILLAMRENYL